MRRSLALLAAVITVAASPAGAREPLDLDLTRLGAPDPAVWLAIPSALGTPTPAEAELLAAESRVRFARLATDLAMAFTSSLLHPASTTGHSGFHFDMEGSYTGVKHGVLGTASYTPAGASAAAYPREYWPTRTLKPTELFAPSVHVRKALPFSIELGGRFTYLSQSSYFAAQLEGKWALMEGYYVLPDVAVRVAWTKVLGQRDLNLSATEFDLMTSKRFGVNAVTSVTPYLALRFTSLDASTKVLGFRADYPVTGAPTPGTPAEVAASSAAFPNVGSMLYRTTVGVRLTSFAVSMAAEATWFDGGKQGKKAPGPGDYPEYWTPASLSGAFKFGFEF
jgi:hypothetical protein